MQATLIPSFKECQTELKTKEFCKSKYFKNEPFFNEIASYIKKTEIFDTEVVQTPNNSALQNICKHYLKKYGIEILLVDPSGLAALWDKVKNKPSLGIILTGDKPYGHVCPILCIQEECFILDVLGDTVTPINPEVKTSKILQDVGIKTIRSAKGIRQADKDSCRIDSITLLGILFYGSRKMARIL